MKQKVTFVLSIIAFAFVFATPRAASASTMSFDAVLLPPCACPAPGFYLGGGNPDGGFTLVTDNGIELALRAKYRQNPAPIHSATNLYAVVAGAQTVATTGGAPGIPGLAAWNWEVDVNLRPNGVGTLTLSQVSVFLTIDDLTALTSTGPFSMFAIPDNATWGAAGERAPSNTAAGLAGGDWGAQNSENPVFAGAAPAGFNMNDAHYYRVSMSAFINGTNGQPLQLLAENSIDISVGGATIPTAVPEPGTMILLGSGLLALASRRRKTVKA